MLPVTLRGAKNSLHCCIANLFRMKVLSDEMRLALAAAKIAPKTPEHLVLVSGTPATDRVALDVLIEELIGIQLRAVAWQIKQPDTSGVIL